MLRHFTPRNDFLFLSLRDRRSWQSQNFEIPYNELKMERVKYGIIGTGYSCKAHIANLNLIDEAEVVAISGRNKENLAKAAGWVKRNKPKTFSDYHQLLKENLDVVIIATPNYTHKQITIDALEMGKNVLCEKPMATTIEDCDAMISTAEKLGKLLQIGLELRSCDYFCKIKEIVERGDIGKPHYLWWKEFRGPFQPGRGEWRFTNLTGGTLLEKNVHHFDIFNWIINSKATRISAFGGKNVYKEYEVIDNAMVIIEYENKTRANLNLCLFSPWRSKSGSHQELGIIGEKGKLEGYPDINQICIFDQKGSDTTCEIGQPPHLSAYGELSDYDKWFPLLYNEHLALVASIKEGKKPIVGGRIGKEAVVLALAAEEAIRTHQVISLKSFTKGRRV